ncbi:LacI family DNA-binding transcriptional regulator [Agreia sp. PsM10]|uniref:LacI family DNA-binding transcriptional regulator n=1 Tax=Agreia sp. PsM10 TaxID=3030533 RepID=UPI00263A6EA0|nr:LacI family DNA-binding transcriptional regulator [Agreia sp. PsM10]MDN4640037.1 LacI family DNA-binding transcriptional regulator [Agreia sp. PsM10]
MLMQNVSMNYEGENVAGIREVATTAGVSMSTVSHVMSGKRHVAPATRARVEDAIARLGYTANPAAAQMRSGRSGAIALVVPTLENPFYPLVAAGMQDILVPRGLLLTISESNGPGGQDVLRHLIARRVDALVAAPFGLNNKLLGELREAKIPFVTLGRVSAAGGDLVHTDDVEGAREITTHLIERGYKKIAFIGGEKEAGTTRERFEGYARAFGSAGRPLVDDDIVFSQFTRAGGRTGAALLLDRESRPDAIVAANDLIAIGILDAARERHLSVPGDLAVTGYDDIDAASLVNPELTTVENPAREIGRACARLLLERLDGDVTDVTRTVALSHRLIVRQSS